MNMTSWMAQNRPASTATFEAWHLLSGVKSIGAKQPCQGESRVEVGEDFAYFAQSLKPLPADVALFCLIFFFTFELQAVNVVHQMRNAGYSDEWARTSKCWPTNGRRCCRGALMARGFHSLQSSLPPTRTWLAKSLSIVWQGHLSGCNLVQRE